MRGIPHFAMGRADDTTGCEGRVPLVNFSGADSFQIFLAERTTRVDANVPERDERRRRTPS